MKKRRFCAIAVAVLAVAPGLAAQVRYSGPRWSPESRRVRLAFPDRLSRLAWLAGCWERRSGQLVTREMWMAPAGELMLGASRTVVGGFTREYEQLRLEARGDTLLYTALPSGQRETEFRSTQVSDSGFVVENPAHDFPQRISYRRRGADSVIARIEGPGPNGTRGINFPMQRVDCAA